MTTARQQVADAIKPVLPKSWRLVPYLTTFDALDRVVLMLNPTKVERFPQAPQGTFAITFEATVLHPSKDEAKSLAALDDDVLETIAALDTIAAVNFTDASPVSYSNYFGWLVTFTVPYNRTD